MTTLGIKWTEERKQLVKEAKRKLTDERFERGEIVERLVLRRILTEKRGYSCTCCGISEWQGKPITLQVDHVDGNPGNNVPSNLRLICPNCHSQCPNWGNRNRGSGRKARGLSTR